MEIKSHELDTDVLIIGSGLAGLLLGLKLAECSDISIAIASKATLIDSNSTFAQGGVAAVTHADAFDSPDTHLNDTLKSGAGLTNKQAAEGIIFAGARLIEELAELGIVFDRRADGVYDLALEGGHSQRRVLHSKDETGRAITTVLADRIRALAKTRKNIRIFENAYATDLITGDGRCFGARFDVAGDRCFIRALHTVLATGGVGQVYSRTTNPTIATGDGIALAYRAGAGVSNMEFVQFHPTALCKQGMPAFLISEAVRGAGAVLLDHNGKRFVKRYHHDGELATRDVVARAIHSVMQEHNLPFVSLDMRPIGKSEIERKFPNIQSTCAQFGIDILKEPIPVSPAAHYFMGGISAGINGVTSMPGLYAIGECACTGLHGANRLASNSLLEAGVMALKLTDHLLAKANAPQIAIDVQKAVFCSSSVCGSDDRYAPYIMPANLARFKEQMYRLSGLVRSESGLTMLLREPRVTTSGELTRRQSTASNILTVGLLIAEAALLRRESLGAHFREDYPAPASVEFEVQLRTEL